MKRLALTAAVLALAATPALAGGPVQSIADATAARGWPHQPSRVEIRDLTASVRRAVTSWAGAPERGRCGFRACTFAWADDATMRIQLRVVEDGSWRTRRITASPGLLPS